MLLSIIIVNWNTAEYLKGCLESIICSADGFEQETIVVDNASDDSSVEMVKTCFPWVRLLQSSQNLGFAQANNLALEQAQGNFLLLLNPDTVLHRDAIKGMVDYLQSHPEVGAVGPKILNSDGSLQISISPRPTLAREAWRLFHFDAFYLYSSYKLDSDQALDARPVDILKGACILVRKKVIDKIGLFDEQFFVFSEEVDLCIRIKESGWGLVWLPKFTITHFGGESTKQIADVMFIELYRNKVRFFRKHGGNLSTIMYKAILFFASVVRWLPGKLLGNSAYGRKRNWIELSRKYGELITALPTF